MPSPLAKKAIDLLSPTLGEFVAKAKVTAACKLAHLEIDTLEKKDLEVFAEKLSWTCENLGQTVANEIKQRALAL